MHKQFDSSSNTNAALRHHEHGYHPIPLPQMKKAPVPAGLTGYAGRNLTRPEIKTGDWSGNMALRLPAGVIGIDVDNYNGKNGAEILSDLEAQLGALPPAPMLHSGREDDSGIRIFRVPVDTMLTTAIVGGVEFIQWFHRYALAPPSVHPEGRQYGCTDSAGEEADYLPPIEELPDLPWPWIGHLAIEGKGRKAAAVATPAELLDFLDNVTESNDPEKLNGIRTRLNGLSADKHGQPGGRHDTAVEAACWATREALAGFFSGKVAVDLLAHWWLKVTGGGREAELASILLWALAEAQAEPDRIKNMRNHSRLSPTLREKQDGAPSMRDQLVTLAEDKYEICRTEDDRPFLVPLPGANVALMSAEAKRSLGTRFRDACGKSPGRTPLDEAWMIVEGLAHRADKRVLPLRVARDSDAVIVDLGDVSGRAIRATASGWEVIARSPTTFKRSKALLEIVEPARDGDARELFNLLAVDPAARDLLLGWLAAALVENMPHPIAVLRGPQGSTKSTTSQVISNLLDPCMADTQSPPKDASSWDVACASRWCVALDNVSQIPEWWSDALCRAVTGAGWARRALYTDDDEVVTKYRRCIIINGITLGGSMRSDLQERLMAFDLARPENYLTEREVEHRLKELTPRVLGGLLDMLVFTLRKLEQVDPVTDLRMTDFATFLRAFDLANNTDAEGQYRQQLADAWSDQFEADEFAQTVVSFVKSRRFWTGTMADLMPELDANYRAGNGGPLPDHWPKTPHALSSWLTRSAVTLARQNVQHEQLPRSSVGRPHRLTWIE